MALASLCAIAQLMHLPELRYLLTQELGLRLKLATELRPSLEMSHSFRN